ncbi:MAG: hypothetical protein MUE58_01940 [Chitinophagaceae bacterium]|jgi:hypothetical protein|nr:hypothetical protein [Chitinophagaceae bacterium]
MQFIKTASIILLFVAPVTLFGQSAYFQQGSKENILLERLEIKAQKDTSLNFSFIKPFNRKWWINAIERIEEDPDPLKLTRVDLYNMQRSKMNSMEWVTGDKSTLQSKKSLWKTFYTTPADLIQVDNPDFFLSVNPVLQLQAGVESASDEFLFLNTRGIVARGLIAKKIGFQTYLTDNQERGPAFVRDRITQYRAVPGAGFYKTFKTTGVDYFDARGSVNVNVAKYLDIQFGYDKQHIGSGYRSLYLSEYPNSYLFLNLNLRVWRLNYVAKTMELTAQYKRGSTDTVFPKKYMAIHHISFNAPKWLTVGLFEGIVFNRLNQFEFSYLNPIIFLRPMEQNNGSADNAFVGVDLKANIARKFQLYTHLLFDEFKLDEITSGDGWWANKWAWQFGGKYIDAFGVKNLDLQAEINLVRPFTYAHNDTVANYTHYNQPLSHPLFSNVRELVGIIRYQPAPKWYLQARVNGWWGGSDPVGENYGNNIFLDTDTRARGYGNVFGQLNETQWVNANFWAAYEWKENFFIEGNLYFRKTNNVATNTVASFGIRWNMHRREYDY